METQNIEYKESWRDEYLKWICGFANAQGGTLFIGIDDDGNVVGIDDAKRLMEDIPNKTRDTMGVVVEANLREEQGKQYLEIKTEAYPYPVNYKGQYHYRSGNTKQELKGAALDNFMLRKQGRTWDSIPVPFLHEADLDHTEFERFRQLVRHKKRMSEVDINVDDHILMEKLRLFEGDYLKRAAALLFSPDPEKYVSGAFVKIGAFGNNDAELLYQDEVHGPLFKQISTLMDLLTTKYMKAWIRYEGLQRIEEFPIVEEALREALMNAVVHKDYSQSIPIQISVYEDKMMIWNCGSLPETWTIETLTEKHGSVPCNPEIANVFFRAGEIESWGRGIETMSTLCKENGNPLPKFKFDGVGLWTIFDYNLKNAQLAQAVVSSYSDECENFAKHIRQSYPNFAQVLPKLLASLSTPKSLSEMMAASSYKSRRSFVRDVLSPLISNGFTIMLHPDNPNHPRQKYYLTEKGNALLTMLQKK